MRINNFILDAAVSLLLSSEDIIEDTPAIRTELIKTFDINEARANAYISAAFMLIISEN